MFTGIIKATGEVGEIRQSGGDVRLSIRSAELPWSEFVLGESISVNGVCLTAIELTAGGFSTDVSMETLEVTTLGGLGAGSRVNLEPALAIGERLGGHLVSGHIDCVGTIKARKADGRSEKLTVEYPCAYGRYIARKGSICIDGVSLTVNEVSAHALTVNIIPHTADVTIAGDYREGAMVNLEVDMLARYLERLVAHDDDNSITNEFLKEHGYA